MTLFSSNSATAMYLIALYVYEKYILANVILSVNDKINWKSTLMSNVYLWVLIIL